MAMPEDRFAWNQNPVGNTLQIAAPIAATAAGGPAAGAAVGGLDSMDKIMALLHLGGTLAKIATPQVQGASADYNIDASRAAQGAQVGQQGADAMGIQKALNILAGHQPQAGGLSISNPISAPTASNGSALSVTPPIAAPTTTPQAAAPASNFQPAPTASTSGSPSAGFPDIRLALLGASPEARGQILDIVTDKVFREQQAQIHNNELAVQHAESNRDYLLRTKADARAEKDQTLQEADRPLDRQYKQSQLNNMRTPEQLAELDAKKQNQGNAFISARQTQLENLRFEHDKVLRADEGPKGGYTANTAASQTEQRMGPLAGTLYEQATGQPVPSKTVMQTDPITGLSKPVSVTPGYFDILGTIEARIANPKTDPQMRETLKALHASLTSTAAGYEQKLLAGGSAFGESKTETNPARERAIEEFIKSTKASRAEAEKYIDSHGK